LGCCDWVSIGLFFTVSPYFIHLENICSEKFIFGRRRGSKFCKCELSRFDDDENFRIYFDYDFLRYQVYTISSRFVLFLYFPSEFKASYWVAEVSYLVYL
jgi:hypothetical protein